MNSSNNTSVHNSSVHNSMDSSIHGSSIHDASTDSIDWNKYLSIIIARMFEVSKTRIPGYSKYKNTGLYTPVKTCEKCGIASTHANHLGGCINCFELEFYEGLTAQSINSFIAGNKAELTNLITQVDKQEKMREIIKTKRQNVIEEYRSLFEHGDFVMLDD